MKGALRLAAHLALGFAGDADYRVGGLAASTPLDPTLGFGARVEVPVLEPYLGVPIGFTLGNLPNGDGPAGSERAWPGFNVGVMAGAYLHTSARLGVMLAGATATSLGLSANKFALNVGVSYLLD